MASEQCSSPAYAGPGLTANAPDGTPLDTEGPPGQHLTDVTVPLFVQDSSNGPTTSSNSPPFSAPVASIEPCEAPSSTDADNSEAVSDLFPASLPRTILVDRSAVAQEPIFGEDDLGKLQRAKAYARDIQAVYVKYLQKAHELKFEASSDKMDGMAPGSVHVLHLHNLSLLSRIYVGSIHFELTEHDLRQAFSGFGPIKSVTLQNDAVTGHHKGYCFIEYETPEAAALAVESLNGGELGGRSIKIGRPNNFPTELPPGIPPPMANRLYFANVHPHVTEPELSQVFSSFGRVTHLALTPDLITKGHKGYGYVQFADPRDANTALQALQRGFQLGGLELKVGRTIMGGEFPTGMSLLKKVPNAAGLKVHSDRKLPPSVANVAKSIAQELSQNSPTTLAVSPSASLLQLPASVPSFERQTITSSIPLPSPVGEYLSAKATDDNHQPTTMEAPEVHSVLVLGNLVTDITEVDEELKEEVMEECASHGGTILRALFSRTVPPATAVGSPPITSAGGVFFYVVFDDPAMATKVRPIFDGRWFDRRRILSVTLPYTAFERLSLDLIV